MEKNTNSDKVETQVDMDSTSVNSISDFDYLPTSTSGKVYSHEGYSFYYLEQFEQSEWVAYELQKGDWTYSEFERPFFNQDPVVESESAHWKNYKKSGYTKGHLCPAGDRKRNYKLFEETFFTSNVSPQLYEFNAGIWNRLEQKTRYWASKYGGVYVITGGILSKDLKTIGEEKVAVPEYFYKVLFSKDKGRMIAFLIPHQESKEPLYNYVVSVDELEQKTKINFFEKLEDKMEEKMESSMDYKKWAF